jgi:opacity protein-like surface antigen
MKKLLYTVTALALTASAMHAQDAAATEDSKFRFGLRISPQPTWFVSGDKNNTPSGAILGFGFGLNLEYRFTSTAALLTGIGGDFEGGRYTVKNDPGNYEVRYWLNESMELVDPNAGQAKGNTGYHLNERKVNATFLTIPAILKMSTKEYNGLKYSGMFGGEIGVRMKAKATDTYYSYTTYSDSAGIIKPKTFLGELTEPDIDINEEAGRFPVRLGMNAGAGVEYRLGGSTSLFLSINYFRSFTNFMQKKSDFAIFRSDGGYQFVRQDLKLTGIRINIGIMF